MRVIYRNVHLEMLFIWVQLDAQISGARVLYAVTCCYLSELEDLLFLLHLMCAFYGHELYMCFDVCHAIFTEVYAMYFCDLCHAVLWVWALQACKLGFVMFLFLGTSDFWRLLLLLFCCYVSMCLQWDSCSFWWCSVRMFCRYSCSLSIHAPICNYGVP